MTEKLSHSEHAARAMLMGRLYDWRDGTYCAVAHDGTYSITDMIDCETFEPVHSASDRCQNWMNVSTGGYSDTPHPRPWARDDP